MRKIVMLEHVSLDGFVAGPKGEMDWIQLTDEMWDYGSALTDASDTALYGRATYEMMAYYWPTAADGPNATKHDKDHAAWVNNATKVVFSKTLESAPWGATGSVAIARGDLGDEVRKLKDQPGKNMFLVGSVTLAQGLMKLGLVDEYWLNVNPVVLGGGRALFEGITTPINLKLVGSKAFACGVMGLHYEPA